MQIQYHPHHGCSRTFVPTWRLGQICQNLKTSPCRETDRVYPSASFLTGMMPSQTSNTGYDGQLAAEKGQPSIGKSVIKDTHGT